MTFCFFLKQRTAYGMRISDWSSNVCSSDLFEHGAFVITARQPFLDEMIGARVNRAAHLGAESAVRDARAALDQAMVEPGRPRRLDLCGKVEVRARGEHQRRLGLTGPSDRA